MEAPLQQLPAMAAAALLAPGFKHDVAAASTTEMAGLQQLSALAAAAGGANGAGGGKEQCPRCASHDTKFCYYNNYNTSQPRHFCRACRRYWTLGGSLRNVPIGGSTRKRMRPPVRRPPVHFAAAAGGGSGSGSGLALPAPSSHSQQAGGLLSSLFALGAAPLLEGHAGFDLGLGLPGLGHVTAAAAEEAAAGLHGALDLRGGPPLLWSTGLLENSSVETWKVAAGGGATAVWPLMFSQPPAASPAGGLLLHGGAAQQPQLL
ncbi:hypothetical protein GUJ93_ZPchr0013g37796 [Zizania palustris]|uniref:Dof zinc finger protein n=1 Tax=Zizania palustris TaxID=103762 RepID=A0A8J5X1E2_ZIZPA|nr:hypothetical protein GUJ93_ZPchr0013g37796 [Zizania palustris]